MFNVDSYLEKSYSKDPKRFKEIEFIVLTKNAVYFNDEKLKQKVDQVSYKKAKKMIKISTKVVT